MFDEGRDTARPILVTGASGFLGEHLLRNLLASNRAAMGTCWSKAIADLQTSLTTLDLTDSKAVDRLIATIQPSAAIHCAAATDVAVCQQNPEQARRVNVEGTRNLMDAMSRKIPEAAVVLVSTDLVYDGIKGFYSHSDDANPISVYGLSKLESERVVLEHPRGAVVRAALMYGSPATHKASFLGWMVDTLKSGKSLTLFEDEYRTPIFVEDLIFGLKQVIDRELTGVWVAGGPERLSRFQMGEIVSEVHSFDKSLLVRSRLSESSYSAPRPADISLDSRQFWEKIGHRPMDFRSAVQQCSRASKLGCKFET